MASGQLERLADDFRNAGARTEADQLLGLAAGFDRFEKYSPGITEETLFGLSEIFGHSLGIVGIKRFPLDTREALVRSGRVILAPNGKTIPEIVAEGLDVKPMPIDEEVSSGNQVFTQPSLRCEVAVDPDHYVLASSVGLPADDQEAILDSFKTEIETQFPGTTAVKGDAVTHVHLALIKIIRDGRDFNRNHPEWAHVQTSSVWTTLRDSVALVGPLSKERPLKLSISVQPLHPSTFNRNNRLVRVGLAPLIVPIDNTDL